MSLFRDGAARSNLDVRLQARALVLALEPSLSAGQVADSLVAMAGLTPAAPIAAGRALRRLETANVHHPTERTGRAVEALGLALGRVQKRSRNLRGLSIDKDGTISNSRGDPAR